MAMPPKSEQAQKREQQKAKKLKLAEKAKRDAVCAGLPMYVTAILMNVRLMGFARYRWSVPRHLAEQKPQQQRHPLQVYQ